MSVAKYHMPAEWEKQQAIWLAWPHQTHDWPGKYESIPWVYVEIIRAIATTQKVQLLVENPATQDASKAMLEDAHCNMDNVTFHQIPTNYIWLRDSGPTFVNDANGKQVLLDWQFNAWAKYDEWQLDNKVPEHIAAAQNYDYVGPIYKDKPVVLEGGSIDVNGSGLLLTTKECLLDQRVQVRNPGLTEADYLNIFGQYLGVEDIIWLNNGIAGDDTHGHVDDITRFVDTHCVITAVESNQADENYGALQANKKILEEYRTNDGKALEIVELPMPKALYFKGERLPASYANFLICNDVVLVPTFNDANDRIALDIIAKCFPKRDVIGIHSVDLVLEFGALHCLSQQQPASPE